MTIKKLILVAAATLALFASPALAQVSSGKVTTAAPSYANNTAQPLSLTTGGALRVDASGGGGSVPISMSCTDAAYTGASPYTLCATQRAIADSAISSVPTAVQGANANAAAPTANPVLMAAWDTAAVRTVLSDNNGILQTAILPSYSGSAGFQTGTGQQVSSAAVGSSLVIKASGGNLFGVMATNGATRGYLMLFNTLIA